MLDSKSLSVSLRVLHIEATDQRRGAEIFASDLVRALDGMGVEQRVAVLRGAQPGLLGGPGDQGGLARRVVDLLADGARRRAIGEAAQERCGARFDIRSAAPRYPSVYESGAAS